MEANDVRPFVLAVAGSVAVGKSTFARGSPCFAGSGGPNGSLKENRQLAQETHKLEQKE